MKKCLIFFILMFTPYIVMAEGEKLINHIQAIADNAGGDNTSMNVIGDTGLAYDNTVDKNLRYVGLNPNNYVKFNGELWRIVGIMNNIEDENGNAAARVKIVRAEDVGAYSFSPSPPEVNNGFGDNEWTYSNALKVLTYFYNKEKGTCRDIEYNEIECDMSEIGLSANARSLVQPVKWNIGAIDDDYFGIKVSRMYSEERSNKVSRKGTASNINNTGFEGSVRKPTWVGNIGLLYSSDYGYATTANDNDEYRDECINSGYFISSNIQTHGWETRENCKYTDWLLFDLYTTSDNLYWTMNPLVDYYHVSISVHGGEAKATTSHALGKIYPTVYLKDNVRLYAGDGSHDNPYLISGFNVTVVSGKDNVSVSEDSDLSEGSKVTITVSKEGSRLKELKILDSKDNEVEYTKISDTKYSFIMPASDVRVLAEFLEIKKEDKKEEIINPNTADRIIAIIGFLVIISLFVGVMWLSIKRTKKVS